jgi:hypothetical protein
MNQAIAKAKTFILRFRTLVFLIALFNFAWFFSGSSFIHHLGTNAITLCMVCEWWWDWSLTNATSLSLFATIALLFAKRAGDAAAFVLSGVAFFQGLQWLSNGPGLLAELTQRYQILAESTHINVWELPDIQYLFALFICITAAIFLVRSYRYGAKAERSFRNIEPVRLRSCLIGIFHWE